jgi:hypothetical protein
MPIFLLSVATGAIVYATITPLPVPALLQLVIGIVEGVVVYFAAAKLLRFSELGELLGMIKKR